ncbi:MAG: uncharacterized protein A8A55_1752 [Amphiamblys sp. WSBS2006]|nr:MAG: uncharacterized protein A8A55_1752 [Amphiamblys sp. WSBS2006]
MKIVSVSLATIPVSVCALSGNFTYVPRDILPRFQTEQDREVYVLDERKQAEKLCSVYFGDAARNKRAQPLRFVYDETEARTRYPNTRDIAGEVARFIAKHDTVDTERKLFFVSFASAVSPVQAVPEGIAEISVLNVEENSIDYLYKKEREHGNIFDSFLIAEEFKCEDKKKNPRIKNFPAKRKEAVLLLSFLAEKGFQLYLEAASSMHGEEGNKWGLKLPYRVSLFVSKENSCCLNLFDLTETRIKRLVMSSFDITKMNLKNTHIEELFLFDEATLDFFHKSIENTEFYVEKVSFGNKLNPKSEKFLKLIERVHEGETTAPRKIKKFLLTKNNFFDFLEEARSISQRKIHVEDLTVTQIGKDTGPETNTRIVVSKNISIRGNAHVLRFIEFGPKISHLDIDEIQRRCRSPGINIPKIKIQLTENKIIVKENLYVLQFLKKNITAAEVIFFASSGKKALESTEITLAAGEMESICLGGKALSVLSSITNEKINTRYMAVMDIAVFSKEETKKKEFGIRERLYMRNTGILFLELLGNTVFIPVIKIEVDRCMKHLDWVEETVGIHIETNALVENNIDPKIKQKIGEIVTQKETVVENKFGYQKLVFKKDFKGEEQSDPEESNDQHSTECQVFEEFKEDPGYEEKNGLRESEEQPITEYKELCFREKTKRYLYCYDFSNYLYGDYED